MTDHEHLCVPIRVRFRTRWICVRCDELFTAPPTRHILMDADTFMHLLNTGSKP